MDGGLALFKEISVRTLSGELPDPSRETDMNILGSPGSVSGDQNPDASQTLTDSMPTNSKLTEDERAGLELVLRLLRSKYLSDTARLEARRERASLFSCSAAASKLARVLRLEAQKCHDDSLLGGGDEEKKEEEKAEANEGGKPVQDEKLAEIARVLESHASVVEPQVPSAPANRSPEHVVKSKVSYFQAANNQWQI